MNNIVKKPEFEDHRNESEFPSPNSESYYEVLEDNLYPDFLILEGEDDKIEHVMLDGEHKIFNEKWPIINENSKMVEKLFLTNYRIVIESEPIVSIPYGYVQEVKKMDKTLKVFLRTGIVVSLEFDHFNVEMSKVNLVYEYINESFSILPFCFDKGRNSEMIITYDSKGEIERMKVNNRQYSIFKNKVHEFCQSYPEYFLIPKGVESNNLYEVKKCRFYSRIPVMTYYHAEKEVGLWRAAKLKDELSVEVIKFDVSYRRQIPGKHTIIKLEENCSSLKGCENNVIFQALPSLKISFFHLTRAYNLMIVNPMNPKDELYKSLSKWYEEIDKLITLSTHVVHLINQNNNVIVEEVYAFDRAAQIMVISEIMLEPFFRTFDGLAILIEKEFVAFGHPFEDRSGFNKSKEYEVSPIFIQLLECIHQLIVTHPTCFEYSSAYLAHIAYETYTTKYKNFCSQADAKQEKQFKNCGPNIWRKELRAKNHYNYHYNTRNSSKGLWEMRKKPSVKEYALWTDYYDTIVMMNGEKGVDSGSIEAAKDIKKYWEKKLKTEI